jgi:hypothetical protein
MNLRKYLSTMKDYDTDDMLSVMGLQKRSSGDWVFPMMAGIGAGMAIGAGLALFLTPYKGTEAREKFVKGAQDAQKLLNTQVGQLSEKVAMLSEKMGITGGTTEGDKQIGTGGVGTSRTVGVGTPASGTVGNGNRGY